MIVTSVPASAAAEARALSNAVAVVTEYNVSKTLALARLLQPGARNLIFVAGASDYDRTWVDDARRELEQYRDRYKISYLVGLPYDEMLRKVSQLSPDTIVIASSVLIDGAGLPYVPPDVAAAVADISPAPVYSSFSNYFGRGIVGGYMDSFESHGVAAADLAFEILSGKPVAALPRETKPLHRYEVDARQLARWGLSTKNLPPGAVVSFREPTVWQQHRDFVVATALVFALQSAFVGILLIQRRRRQRVENLLKESEERMTFTAASMNVGLWQFDPASSELWATEHCRALFGLGSEPPLTPDLFLAPTHPEYREIPIAALRTALISGQSTASDVRVVLPGNQVRWVRVRARSHSGGGGAANQMSGIFADITEQKAAESESRQRLLEVVHLNRSAAAGAFSASIAHELNQPLGTIQSNAEAAELLLAASPLDLGQVKEILADILCADRRAAEIIRRLRKLLRRSEIDLQRFDLNEAIADALHIISREAQERGVAVRANGIERPLPVRADQIHLQQVILNLVANGMDAMKGAVPGAREITIVTTLRAPSEVEVSVADSGTGIPNAKLEQVFDTF